ncbi:DUF1028 domain-containing protein [Knoellia sp. p5-6-4]|uniref:DUF1028 domain-containing protein n=1 Tax=unclassified Knoellia TaxID=2618719 RepID=UPI0023DC4516|nr:DUF1028 domain-containing protein [Knoellia sp. p5-6-4]MDF2145610.1 DUF1028 domain-containing protein [Knoellia sp. p5-6-4]
MTFSVVGQVGDAFGVAVASRFIAVGSVVPAARVGVGAVATQAMAKVSYKEDVLELLASGASAPDAVARVTAADEGAAHRQLGVVAAHTQASHTGDDCLHWAGGASGRDDTGGYAIQGNILTGPEVVERMQETWLARAGLPLPRRLVETLLAGDASGGDSRGRQGAALYAVAPGAGYDASGVLADLRVDDHPDATRELARLLDEHELVFGAPEDVRPLEGVLAGEVAQRLGRLGHRDDDTAAALAAWAGERNLEMRLTDAGIDARVLEALRRESP